MRCAVSLKKLGCNPMIIEKSSHLGGKLNGYSSLCFNDSPASEIVRELSEKIVDNEIRTLLCCEVLDVKKEGNFIEVNTADGTTYEAEVAVLAAGFSYVDMTRVSEYGYKVLDNVITSVELERMLEDGEIVTKNSKIPETVAFIHCAGSRTLLSGVEYCSKMCCATALGQSRRVKSLLGDDSAVFQFFTDMRVWGEYGENLYRSAEESGVSLIRGGVSEIKGSDDGKVTVWAEDMVLQRVLRLEADMVVLMNGAMGARSCPNFGDGVNVKKDKYGFVATRGFTATDTPNVFAIGCAAEPKSVKESLKDADSAALSINEYFAENG